MIPDNVDGAAKAALEQYGWPFMHGLAGGNVWVQISTLRAISFDPSRPLRPIDGYPSS